MKFKEGDRIVYRKEKLLVLGNDKEYYHVRQRRSDDIGFPEWWTSIRAMERFASLDEEYIVDKVLIKYTNEV